MNRTSWGWVVALGMVPMLITGCAKKAEQSIQVNAEFQVDTLFTKDGCTVYRFEDEGTKRYFTNCRGTVAWQQTYQAGKNQVTRPEEVTGGGQ